MKAKKSEKANLENKRGLYFQLGLIISLCATLSAFEWSSSNKSTKIVRGNLVEEPIYTVEFVVPQQKQQQALNQTKPKVVKPSTTIKVVKKEVKNPEIDSAFIDDFKVGEDGDTKPVIETIIYTDPNKKYKEYEVSKSPSFPGGEDAIRYHINSTIKIPQITIDKGVPAKLYLSFVVNQKGKVVDVKFINGRASNQLIKEAIRVISNMPDWIPGEKDGAPVSVMRYIPINVVVK